MYPSLLEHTESVPVLQGSAAQLAEAAPHLMELDVSCNLISTWQFAVDLSAALPALDILNLSTNRIALNRPVAPPSLPGLRALILNSCGVTWPEVSAGMPLIDGL